jgi:Ca-activated chloride channel family protein
MDLVRQFGVVWPLALLFIPGAIACGVLLIARARVKRSRCQALGVASQGSGFAASLLALLPLVLMGLALLRPYLGRETIELPASSSDYMFLVDVSRSMLAKDVPPSRMGLAKRKMRDIIEAFTKRGESHRYGITVFAGGVYSLCPLTDDISVVEQFINIISPELVTSMGSNLEEGVVTALERFKGAKSQRGRILLISDGEDSSLVVDRVVGIIKGAGVRVDVLGVGTPVGSPIQYEEGRFIRDSRNEIVHSKLNEASLELIRATLSDEDILRLIAGTSSPLDTTSGGVRSVTTYREVGSWIALAALVVFLITAALHRSGFALSALLCLVALTSSAYAETPTAVPEELLTARAAFDLYNKGRFAESVTAFSAATKNDPDNRALQQGYASALFKTGQYEKAQGIFRSLADSATTGRSYFENTFNEGNALLAQRKLQEAIDAYTKALDVKPGDEQAIHNRGIARRLLEEAKRYTPTPTSTPTATPTATPAASPSSQPSPSPQPSPQPSPSAEPSPSAQPSASPSGQPSPSPSAQPSGSPSPGASPTPGQQGTPQGSPSPNASASPSPGGTAKPEKTGEPQEQQQQKPESTPEERKKEAPEQPEGSPSPAAQATAAAAAARELNPSLKEAEAWLKSLPDSPLLLRRDKPKPQNRDQTW